MVKTIVALFVFVSFMVIMSCSNEPEGKVIAKKKNYNLDSLTALIEKNPDVDSLYFKRGCQLMREDKHKEAIGDFDKVLSLAEGRTKKEVIKVDDLEFSKELNEQLDKAFSDIFSNKTRSKVLNNRGMCKLKMKDVNGAWSDFMGAIMADSLNTNAMNGLGLLSWRIRDYEMAKSSLDKAFRLGDSTLIDLSIKINKKLNK